MSILLLILNLTAPFANAAAPLEPAVPERFELVVGEPVEVPAPPDDRAGVRRARVVELDRGALGALARGDHGRGTRLEFEAFPGEPVELEVEAVRVGWSGATILSGRIAGDPWSAFTLVTDGARAAATLRPTGRPTLALRGFSGGQWIAELDEALLPTCGATHERLAALDRHAREQAAALGLPVVTPQSAGGPPPTAEAGSATFDVLVLYTPAAQVRAGGPAAIALEIELAVAEGDTAFADSGIGADMRLVGAVQVDYSEANATHDQHLFRLSNPFDGVMDQIHGWRAVCGADLVSLVVDDSDGDSVCGLGYILPAQPLPFAPLTGPFNTVDVDCLPSFTLIHELGHNMGCAHDFGNASIDLPEVGIDLPPIPSTQDAYGWRFTGGSGTQWRTIMAYPPGQRIGRYSNPLRTFDGVPTGLASSIFTVGADNAGAINFNAGAIQGFQGAVSKLSTVHVDLNASPLVETGSSSFPYDTLQEGLLKVLSGGTLLVRGSDTNVPPIAQRVTVDGWTSNAVLTD